MGHEDKKKLRCKVIEQTVAMEGCARQTPSLCRYYGITRQGYYRHRDRLSEVEVLKTSLLLYSQQLRAQLPMAGSRKLYALCRKYFREKMVIGRDQYNNLLRANGLMLRKHTYRPRTTYSNHHYFIHPDLLNTTPKYRPQRIGDLMVVDITYVPTLTGWAFLSLVTDAYSRIIVGYALSPTLDTAGPLAALRMALDFYQKNNIPVRGSIHHSDRGTQYCSNEYIKVLTDNGIRVSMTQCGDPLHNALAERMNNTIKNGFLFDCEQDPYAQVLLKTDRAIHAYNTLRPHQALGMKTPMEMLEIHRFTEAVPLS